MRIDGEGEGRERFAEGGEVDLASGVVVELDIEEAEVAGMAGGEFSGEFKRSLPATGAT